ncbi:MAG: hypothetical protein CR967_01490 [Proteobacteria bacterium]|nr:MAG: hypothetical protein CR967_01490 [Pseudomonadota bacterium]
MTTFQLNTNDAHLIQQAKNLLVEKLHLKVNIVQEQTAQKSKWAKMAEEMRGVLNHDDVEYLQECSREIRDNFEVKS